MPPTSSASRTMLPTMTETHAPMSILPFEGDVEHAAALGQDAGQCAEGQRGGELEGVAEDPGEICLLAAQHRGEDGEDERDEQDEQPRPPPERRAAPHLERADDRRRDAGDDPQQADRGGDLESLPSLVVEQEQEGRGDPEGARRKGERQRSEAEEGKAADPGVAQRPPCRDALALGNGRGNRRCGDLHARNALAARRDRRAHNVSAGAVGRDGGDLGRGLRHLHPPDRPDQAGRGHEHDDHGDDEAEELGRNSRLDAHLLATVRQGPEQECRDDDPARPEARQQGERDRVEPDAAREVVGQLSDRPDDHEPAAHPGKRRRRSTSPASSTRRRSCRRSAQRSC